MAALEMAAHAHQIEANPEIVSHAMTMTATRLTAPKITTLRYPEISSAPRGPYASASAGPGCAGDLGHGGPRYSRS